MTRMELKWRFLIIHLEILWENSYNSSLHTVDVDLEVSLWKVISPKKKLTHYSVMLPHFLTCNQDKNICLMLALSDPLLLSCTLVPTAHEV